MFERDDLDIPAFLADLRRTVSDDALLSEYIAVAPRRRVRRVGIGGTVRETLERHVRFTQIVHRHDSRDTVVMGATTAAIVAVTMLVPLPAVVVLTLLVAGAYAAFGVRRWTALLAAPSILLQLPLTVYALSRRIFVWGGRRYRFRGKFDVEVVG